MGNKKKSYAVEFKARVALASIRGDLTINEISSKYGIHSSQISRWKQQAMLFIKSGFTGKHQKQEQSEQQLVDQLYRQIGQCRICKK